MSEFDLACIGSLLVELLSRVSTSSLTQGFYFIGGSVGMLLYFSILFLGTYSDLIGLSGSFDA